MTTVITDEVTELRGLINRSLSKMPYGAACYFAFADVKKETEQEFLGRIAANLQKLVEVLEGQAKLSSDQMVELLKLQQQRQAIRDFLGI